MVKSCHWSPRMNTNAAKAGDIVVKKTAFTRIENKAGATAGSGGEEYKPTIDDVNTFFINGPVNTASALDVTHLS